MNECTNTCCVFPTPSCAERNQQSALKVILAVLGALLAFTVGLVVGAFAAPLIIDALAAVIVLAGLLLLAFIIVLICYCLGKRRCCGA